MRDVRRVFSYLAAVVLAAGLQEAAGIRGSAPPLSASSRQ
jgi:hypothetical protein